MNNRFNPYSRTEEEKTQDMLIYEKKAKAASLCESYNKVKKKTDLFAFLAFLLSAGIGTPFFFKAYDGEMIIAMILIIIGVAAFTVGTKIVSGAILAHSLTVFVKWGTLSAKWTVLRKELHKFEAAFEDQTVFEPDLKKAESRLLETCDALIAFAEKHRIEITE